MPGQDSGHDDDDFDLDLSLDFSDEETEAPVPEEETIPSGSVGVPPELAEAPSEIDQSFLDPAPDSSFLAPSDVVSPSPDSAEQKPAVEDVFAIDLDEAGHAEEKPEVIAAKAPTPAPAPTPKSEPVEDLSKEDLAAALEDAMRDGAKSVADPVISEAPASVVKKTAQVIEDTGGEGVTLRSAGAAAAAAAAAVSTAEILKSREPEIDELPLTGKKKKTPTADEKQDALAKQEAALKKDEELLQGEIERLEKEFGPKLKKGPVFAVLGLVAALVAGYAIFKSMGPGKDPAKQPLAGADGKTSDKRNGLKEETGAQPSGYKAALESASTPATDVIEPVSSPPSGDLKAAARVAVQEFFSAESLENLLKVSRDPARVEPLMRRYYENHALFPREVRSVELIEETTLGKKTFWLMDVELDRFEQAAVLVERIGDRFLVDWETWVHYNPVEWETFVEKQPKGEFDMRVHATLHSDYRYPFSDDKKYLCVQLGDFKSDREIFGYADRDSPVAERIRGILTGEYTNESEYPLILTLEYPENATSGQDLVHIRDFVTEHWIIVDSE